MKRATSPISLGPIDGLLLLGGGPLLRLLCLWAGTKELPINVVTSPRLARQTMDGETLGEFLENNRINYIVVEKLSQSEVREFLENCKNHFFLSLGAPWIFKETEIEDLFSGCLFNLHGARLPQNRGGGGFSWQIMTGNRFGFCVLHQVDGGVDSGHIVAWEEFLYPVAARIPSDYETLYTERNLKFLITFITSLLARQERLSPIPQSEWFATYWPRLNSDQNGLIDWSLDPGEIERFICAFDDPYRGASTFLNDRKVFLKKVSLSSQDGVFHPFQRGLIYRKSELWFCVALGGGFALIVESAFNEEGENLMPAIRVGDRFITPSGELESALRRVSYSPLGLD